jgi:hypothetical protein
MRSFFIICFITLFSLLHPVQSSWWTKIRDTVENIVVGKVAQKAVTTLLPALLLPVPDKLP